MDLLIIAAGKGSRMNSNLPKALAKVGTCSNLERNCELVKNKFNKIFVVISKYHTSYFKNLNLPHNVEFITIESGKGSGHAILEALKKINKNHTVNSVNSEISDQFCTIWGDAVITDCSIFDEVQSTDIQFNKMLIPVYKTMNPYVSFISSSELAQYVDFSKYNETHNSGYQDICLFLLNKSIVEDLQNIHNSLWKGSRYIAESSEFEFLYIIQYLHNINNSAELYIIDDNIYTKSYNTEQELTNINESLISV